jgi:hypothetical protein
MDNLKYHHSPSDQKPESEMRYFKCLVNLFNLNYNFKSTKGTVNWTVFYSFFCSQAAPSHKTALFFKK